LKKNEKFTGPNKVLLVLAGGPLIIMRNVYTFLFLNH